MTHPDASGNAGRSPDDRPQAACWAVPFEPEHPPPRVRQKKLFTNARGATCPVGRGKCRVEGRFEGALLSVHTSNHMVGSGVASESEGTATLVV
jgi:hypothetical protein